MGNNNNVIITVSTREATLKKHFRRHLKSLGFHKADDGTLMPPGTGKDAVRTIHSAQRNDRLAASQNFLSTRLPKHQFIIAGWGITFDADRERQSNNNIRRMLRRTRERVLLLVHGGDEKAAQKARQYVAALDAQLAICDETDAFIATLGARCPKPQT